MTDVLITAGIIIGCVVSAVVILAARDTGRRRLWKERTPVTDQIAEIRASAAFMAQQFQDQLERKDLHHPDAVAWITAVLDYYRQLEKLAAAADPSADEIHRLAEEASAYVRQHRLKGIIIADEAEQLAELVRRRNAA